VAASDEPLMEGHVQYKVMTQKDRLFGGKFNPEKLEQALNAMASEGWRVNSIATATFPSLGGGREELVIILERVQ
jgi:hypothetical protein